MPGDTIAQAINDSNSVVISGHINPDGDAIGASMALALALKKMGKDVFVVLEEYNERFNIIPGHSLLYHGNLEALEPDTFIAVDCGSVERLGRADVFLKKTACTINIDHHISNTRFARINLVDAAASSTSEIVFEIVNKLLQINSDIASALYAGMVYDTGGFRHGSTTLKTLAAAGAAMGLKIPFSQIYNELMLIHTVAEARALGRAISHLELYAEGRIAYTYITREDMAEVGAARGDLGGICEYALNTAGVRIAMFIYHKNSGCKISLRSTGVAINKIAEHFGGGGHELASGCDFDGTIECARDTVMDMLMPLL